MAFTPTYMSFLNFVLENSGCSVEDLEDYQGSTYLFEALS